MGKIFPQEMSVRCRCCGYEIEEMKTEKVFLTLAEQGGFIIYDGDGGYESYCPKCHKDRLCIND